MKCMFVHIKKFVEPTSQSTALIRTRFYLFTRFYIVGCDILYDNMMVEYHFTYVHNYYTYLYETIHHYFVQNLIYNKVCYFACLERKIETY